MAAAASPPPVSEPEKKHKRHKSEKKRSRDEEDAPVDERKHKKSKSSPQAIKLEMEPNPELKTEKKKKKKKRKEEEEEEGDKKHKRGPELGEAPATESPKEKHKKKHKEAGDGAEAAAPIENEETEKTHKKSKHSEDTSALDPKAGKKKNKRKLAENTSEANEAAVPAAMEHEAETKHEKSKHDEEAIANGDAPVSKEGKKRHKKRHKGADGETSAAAETPVVADEAVADEAVAEKKHKKKKSKDKDKATAVANEAGDADAKKEKTKSKKHASKDGESAAADAMDIDEPELRTSSKTYQPPDMPADPQFPFFSQIVSLYEPLYPSGWAQPVTNAQYQHLQHLLNKYVPSLGGVLLGYKNVAVGPTPGRDGAATDDEAPTTVLSRNEYAVGFGWITADVELFVPSRGAWMEGSVNLQTEGHIGLVCFGRFNASIEARRLPPAWKWVSNESPEALGVEETASVVTADDHGVVRQVHSTGFWVDAAGGRVRGRVRFRIRNFDAGASGDVSYLSLEGTMLDRDSEKRLVREEAFTAQMRREKRGGPRPERRRAPDFSMTRFADDAEPAQAPVGDGNGAT